MWTILRNTQKMTNKSSLMCIINRKIQALLSRNGNNVVSGSRKKSSIQNHRKYSTRSDFCRICIAKSYINLRRRYYVSRCKEGSDAAKSSDGDPVDCSGKPGCWPTGNRANFQFHPETEASMNKQLSAELKAFYYYLSMAAYFGRVDVALPGCESFFIQMHHEEHGHALRFFNYIKMRGGLVTLCPVQAPEDQDWKCPLNAFKTALQLEIEVTEKLVEVNCIAEKHKDLNASDFIVTGFMEEQMKSVNEMAKLVTVLSGVGDQTLARFMFDKDLLENYVMPEFNIIKKAHDERPNEKETKK